MKLLCHRGMWANPNDQNTLEAIMRAINQGFGIETDIRDHDGSLVISHDPPVGECILPLERLLEAYICAIHKPLLALNVKADGLQKQLDEMLRTYKIANYFVFDMSVPDCLLYLKRDMQVAARLSEYEDGNCLLNKANTVWLDAFESEWYSIKNIMTLLDEGKRICVVSPELHRRPHAELWSELTKVPHGLAERLYLCTDLFDQAQEVFDIVYD